ncbi:MAG: cadherin domain-containing protein [Prolixibacteraceae bacterium]|nr:cadherin domain-containing protein [Prolixibacteraceae bacterium]
MKNFYSLLFLFLVFTSTVKAQVSEQEFQALKALYNATDGDNWFNRTGWENINTTATKDDVTTEWFGIKEIKDGHLTKISFRGVDNNLSGQLPPEIGNLVWLFELSLSDNHLSGTLPEEIGNLANLDHLGLGSNNISGPLPASFSALVNLRSLSLSYNPLNCDFPSEILAGLSNIRRMDLYYCGLSGTLGNVFASIPKLEALDITGNQISGEIPASINELTSLVEVHFDENQLSGSLPSIEGSVASIYYLTFSDNQFTGSIPPTYGNFYKIRTLNLDHNQLSGTIPAGIFLSISFQKLNVQNNYFTFEGLEPIANRINTDDVWKFDTKKKFPLNQEALSVNAGDALALNAAELSVFALGGNNNRYKWFCNDVEVYSGNSPVYAVTSAGASHAGVYRFEVTNTVVTDITLKSENITVNIIGGNEAPTDIVLSATSVDENFSGIVASLTATDPDAGDVHAFALASGNGTNDKHNGKFQIIDGNQLKMISSADYETTPSLNVLITVNDGNGGVFTKAITIAVNNINEAPRYTDQTTSTSIDENADNGFTVCTLTAQDPEGAAVTYSITSGNDNGAFGINGNQLVVADNTKLNYDTKNQYSLVVSASDETLGANATITVSLNKINQLPQVENSIFVLDENSPEGTIVGRITATDREDDPLTYSITAGNIAGAFTLDGNTIEVAGSAPLDYETTPQFILTVSVSDGVSNVQVSITINLNNVADNADNDILTFSVPGIVGEASIAPVNHTVAVTVTDVAREALTAEFTLSPGAESDPASGTVLDFTNAQTITVIAESGDEQEWTVTVGFQTDNPDFETLSLMAYPNPASDVVHISGTSTGDKLSIFTLSGRKIYAARISSSPAQVSIANLAPGNYILRVDSQKQKATFNIIKK